MKQWAALLTAIAGLLLAAASFVQAVREPKARAAYDEHAKTIAATQEAASANHVDIERLTTYVATQPPPQVVMYDPPSASGHGGMGGSGGSPPPRVTVAPPPSAHPLKPQPPPRAFDSL